MAQHTSGSQNEIANALSRQQWSRFRLLAPWADTFPCSLPSLNPLIYPNDES